MPFVLQLANRLARLGLATLLVVISVLGSGCAMVDIEEEDLAEMRTGPAQRPQRNITDFDQGLACMDGMFLEFGIRNVGFLSTEIQDNTRGVNVGARDMLITAVSQMARRSSAIRMGTFSDNESVVLGWLQNAGKDKQVYQGLDPLFYVRGSITQLDKDVIKKEGGFGISNRNFGFGGATGNRATIVGLDLHVARVATLEVLPGITSHNTVAVFKRDWAVDGDGLISSAGVDFEFAVERNEGMHQAVRNMVDLATIELMGRLFKIPYWQCLGVKHDNAYFRRELRRWHQELVSNNELIVYLQRRLLAKGYYRGPIDNQFSDEFLEAVLSYRSQRKLSGGNELDLPLFVSLVNSDARHLDPDSPGLAFPGVQEQGTIGNAGPGNGNLTEYIDLKLDKPEYSLAEYNVGDKLTFSVRPSKDMYVYCFYKPLDGGLVRVFPNRHAPNPFIRRGQRVSIPDGRMKFDIVLDKPSRHEQLVCLGVEEPTPAGQILSVRQPDLKPLSTFSVDMLIGEFSAAYKGAFVQVVRPLAVLNPGEDTNAVAASAVAEPTSRPEALRLTDDDDEQF